MNIILWRYAVSIGKWLPTFHRIVLPTPSGSSTPWRETFWPWRWRHYAPQKHRWPAVHTT